jgi:heme exporter protein D
MYLIVIAWLYVTLLMGLAEAFSAQGTVLGALITFIVYGVLPVSLVVYLMGTPLRRQAMLRQEQAQRTPENTQASTLQPDASGHATRLSKNATVPTVGEKP